MNATDILGDISSSTTEGPEKVAANPIPFAESPPLKVAHDVLIVLLLIAVMFAMGCHITWEQVWHHVRRPVSVLIGLASQFVLLPFSAWVLITTLGLSPLHATGMLLLACSPGGVTSNIFAYLCDGDISLSITMTACSTVVALGMMPFNLWLYGRGFAESSSVVIPYGRMAVSLVSVTAPVLAGMAVHWRFPKAAHHLTKIGTYAGLLIIIVCQTMEFFIFPDIFAGVPWQVYVAVTVLPLCGLSLGYGAAFLARREPPVCRTVAIESGIQNVGTALTVASLSFSFQILKDVLLFPWMYAFSMLGVCIVVSSLYQLYKRTCGRTAEPAKPAAVAVGVTSLDMLERGKSVNGQKEMNGISNAAYVTDSCHM